MLETHQTHHVKLFNPIIVIYIRDYLIKPDLSSITQTRRCLGFLPRTPAQPRPTTIFILGGNSNIVTPLNAFMETFLARNVHFTFIMFAR